MFAFGWLVIGIAIGGMFVGWLDRGEIRHLQSEVDRLTKRRLRIVKPPPGLEL